ncbi:hypothetical protein HGG75_09025 [Ochrobactrum pseudogrignonense]|nr:hypothetical protein [Brucella pseudogrignonensis]
MPIDQPEPDQSWIGYAAKRACCSSKEVLDLILGKKLEWIGRDLSTTGYKSILVNVDEIKRLTQLPRSEGLTLQRAAEKSACPAIQWQRLSMQAYFLVRP